jgi:hypothetical protein
MNKTKTRRKARTGDLVKMGSDPKFFFGFGIVLELSDKGNLAKVYWFDDFTDEKPIDWEQASILEILSEGR